MTVATKTRLNHDSQLDIQAFAHLPYYAQTVALFRAVREHDFATLAKLCDDDFGIIDLDTEGKSVVIETRAEWETWFHSLFSRLDLLGAETDTEILDYQASQTAEMGFSVVRFCQRLWVGEVEMRFTCAVTIVWKLVDGEWREARWHCSLLDVEQDDAR